jgi:hypothetical protein
MNKSNITTVATQAPRLHLGGPAVISITGTWGGTTVTFEVNLDSSDGASDNWAALEDSDGAISLTANKAFATEPLPQCSIRAITTGGSGIDLDLIIRVGKY